MDKKIVLAFHKYPFGEQGILIGKLNALGGLVYFGDKEKKRKVYDNAYT